MGYSRAHLSDYSGPSHAEMSSIRETVAPPNMQSIMENSAMHSRVIDPPAVSVSHHSKISGRVLQIVQERTVQEELEVEEDEEEEASLTSRVTP